jgi:hypothetical protein
VKIRCPREEALAVNLEVAGYLCLATYTLSDGVKVCFPGLLFHLNSIPDQHNLRSFVRAIKLLQVQQKNCSRVEP